MNHNPNLRTLVLDRGGILLQVHRTPAAAIRNAVNAARTSRLSRSWLRQTRARRPCHVRGYPINLDSRLKLRVVEV